MPQLIFGILQKLVDLPPLIWDNVLTESNNGERSQMNIRKDNYIVSGSVYGRVMSVNKAEDSIVLMNGVVVMYSESSKISKSEYDNHYYPLIVIAPNETKVESSNTPKKAINKKEVAISVYANFVGPYRRRDMIKSFMRNAELSKRGAETYYYNVTSGKWTV